MNYPQDPMEHLAELLETKACIKQQTFRNVQQNFKALKKEAQKIINHLKTKVERKDEDVKLEVIDVTKYEFHVRIAGDLLIFFMHSNIVMLGNDHRLNQSKYVTKDPMRKYLGQINVYNFMADAVNYNRLNDPGYLIARLFINFESRFLIEGGGQLNYMGEEVSSKAISPTDISIFVQLVMSQAIELDLITAPFASIKSITLLQKIEKSQALGGGYKLGFQMPG